MIETVDQSGRIVEPSASAGEETLVEKLTPLRFSPVWNEVQNGILTEEDPLYDSEPDYSAAMVGYFLTVEVDSEIPTGRLCEALPEARKRGVLQNDGALDCSEEGLAETGETIDRATHGLYDPLINADDGPFGEDCD